jgi:hypothetical protein
VSEIPDADSSTDSGRCILWKLWITGLNSILQDFLHAGAEKSLKKQRLQAGIARTEIEYNGKRCRNRGETRPSDAKARRISTPLWINRADVHMFIPVDKSQ